jgi:hypothetical protein
MGCRIYDPTIGRFAQADPIVQAPENGQSLNRYSYVYNNPLSYTDPFGYVAVASTRGHHSGGSAAEVVDTHEVIKTKKVIYKGVVYTINLAVRTGSTDGDSKVSEGAFSTNVGDGAPKPTDSDGWEYTGQTKRVETYQTTYTPDNSDDGTSIGDVNDNIVTPTGLVAGYIQNKTENTKRRWSDKYKNHGKIWDKARLIGNYAFLVGGELRLALLYLT